MFKCVVLSLALASSAFAAPDAPLRGPVPIQQGDFLRVEGNEFRYGSSKVFLSGTNPAWIQYGNDFGNDQYETATGARWRSELQAIGGAGGNSVRVWVHVEGEQTPLFDGNGFVTGTDRTDTLISDLRHFLDDCQANGIFMNLVLWNGALMRQQKMKDLFYDDDKLQSYIDNALIPMVNGLKDHPALMAWEVINEPEGSSPVSQTDPDPCFDFTHLTNTRGVNGKAPGWSGANIPIKNLLRFINWHASAIHQNDPKSLVNVGSWSQYAQCDSQAFGDNPTYKYPFNHYKDDCLIKAGGKSDGTMDFWQFHTYPYNQQWIDGAPWSGYTYPDYEYSLPLVVGEFPTEAYSTVNEGQPLPNGDSTPDLYEYLYTNGFHGAWSWDFGENNTPEEDEDVLAGLRQLQGRSENGLVEVVIG